jgi:hypothetical protein
MKQTEHEKQSGSFSKRIRETNKFHTSACSSDIHAIVNGNLTGLSYDYYDEIYKETILIDAID